LTPIVVKDEIMISREPALIWDLLTNVSRWSRVNKLIRRAAIYGPPKPGTEFKFISGKWDFDAVIIEAAPESGFIFDAKSIGLRLHFVWEIAEEMGKAKIIATISAGGWITILFNRRTKRSLEDNLFTCLYSLKTTLERGEKPESGEEHGIAKPHRIRRGFDLISFFFKHHKGR
jgi:hypothetical protein